MVAAEVRTTAHTATSRLHQPARGVVVIFELVLAGICVFGALWAWRYGTVPMQLPNAASGAPDYEVTRYVGHWLTLAVLLIMVSVIASIDAIRQYVLATRGFGKSVKHRKR